MSIQPQRENRPSTIVREFTTLRGVPASDTDALRCLFFKYSWWFGTLGPGLTKNGGSLTAVAKSTRALSRDEITKLLDVLTRG
jgi:hypothetical protein